MECRCGRTIAAITWEVKPGKVKNDWSTWEQTGRVIIGHASRPKVTSADLIAHSRDANFYFHVAGIDASDQCRMTHGELLEILDPEHVDYSWYGGEVDADYIRNVVQRLKDTIGGKR